MNSERWVEVAGARDQADAKEKAAAIRAEGIRAKAMWDLATGRWGAYATPPEARPLAAAALDKGCDVCGAPDCGAGHMLAF